MVMTVSLFWIVVLIGVFPGFCEIISLGKYGADSKRVSVSGLSSGGYMAVQIHVGFSETFMGVGVVAGGPYYCAQGDLLTAVTACMSTPEEIDVSWLSHVTRDMADTCSIGYTVNMRNDKVYLYSGNLDEIVVPGVMVKLEDYFREFVDDENMKTEFTISSGHAFITDNYGNHCDTVSESPYISNCGYNQAYEILNHIYGLGLELSQFSQKEFHPFYDAVSLDEMGYVYVPVRCQDTISNCSVHVSFHGCNQGRHFLNNEFAKNAGYNEVAELNDIIIIYPQAAPTPENTGGCWDWWGYTGEDYSTRAGDQMQAIKKMVDRVLS